MADELYAHFLRADRAHAHIKAIDSTAALGHPGVKHILTGDDAVKAGYVNAPHALTFPGINGMQARTPDRPVLAHGKIRFVGEPLRWWSQPAPRRRRTRPDSSNSSTTTCHPQRARNMQSPGATQLHDNVPGNMPFETEAGDAQDVEAAFSKAAHVTRLKVESTRVSPMPDGAARMSRGLRCSDDAIDSTSSCRVLRRLRKQISSYTNMPEDKLIFEARDVGGGFGQRTVAYPEYCALMIAAKALGKPVKWVSTRVEAFLTDTHGRANIIDGELALDSKGKFLGMRILDQRHGRVPCRRDRWATSAIRACA